MTEIGEVVGEYFLGLEAPGDVRMKRIIDQPTLNSALARFVNDLEVIGLMNFFEPNVPN